MRPGYLYLFCKYTRWAHPFSGVMHCVDEFLSRLGF